MLFEILIAIGLGMVCGVFTGLIPGVHNNMISQFLFLNVVFLGNFFSLNELVIFIITMGVVHSFVSFIPAILFGIPSEETCMSILPAHKMVLEGKAYEAIHLSAISSLFGMFFSFFILLILYNYLEIAYEFSKDYIGYFLIFVLFLLVYLEKDFNKKFWAIIVILFSTSLGFLSLNSLFINNPLLLLFSGLFGISGLFMSLLSSNSKIPKQFFDIKFSYNFKFYKSIFNGGISASICSISPGLGNAQAASISSLFSKNSDGKDFIVITSAINTINFILSFMTFYIIDRARNGSVIVISYLIDSINLEELFLYFSIIFFISIISFFIVMKIGKIAIKKMLVINFKILNFLVILLIFALAFLFDGFIGIIVLITASALGIFCLNINVRRVHMMAILLVPIVFNLL
jgi:putative membrane protein